MGEIIKIVRVKRGIGQDLSLELYDFLNFQGQAHEEESLKETENEWSEKFEEKSDDIMSQRQRNRV